MDLAYTAQRYHRLGSGYDRAHARWLAHAGGEAQCAFEGAVSALVRPGMAMLDMACGTGTVARRLLRSTDTRIELTLLDAAPAILAQCRDIPARRVLGRMETLPFPDHSFDLVSCAWGLETLGDPSGAILEALRVTRPGGHIAVVFCAETARSSLAARLLKFQVKRRGLGQFLDPASVARSFRKGGASWTRALHCHGPSAAILARA